MTVSNDFEMQSMKERINELKTIIVTKRKENEALQKEIIDLKKDVKILSEGDVMEYDAQPKQIKHIEEPVKETQRDPYDFGSGY